MKISGLVMQLKRKRRRSTQDFRERNGFPGRFPPFFAGMAFLAAWLFIIYLPTARAVETYDTNYDFSTSNQSMWNNGGAGLSTVSFSHDVINQSFSDQSYGSINDQYVNPVWSTWNACMQTCEAITAYNFSDSDCENGKTVNAQTAAWLWWYGCVNTVNIDCGSEPTEYYVLASTPGCGSEPTHYVKDGAALTVSNLYLLAGFTVSETVGEGMVDADYNSSGRISVGSVMQAGDHVTISTTDLGKDADGNITAWPTLSTQLYRSDTDLSVYLRSSAKAQLQAYQSGLELYDQTFLNYDTGTQTQSLASLIIGGNPTLQLKFFDQTAFETENQGVSLTIPWPVAKEGFVNVGVPMGDIALFLPNLNTPGDTWDDSSMHKVYNTQLKEVYDSSAGKLHDPSVCFVSTCPAGNVAIDFSKLDLDLAAMSYAMYHVPLGVNVSVSPPGVASFTANLLAWNLGAFFGLAQDMSLDVNVGVKFTFSKPVQIVTTSGNVTTTSYTVNLGDSLTFIHPGGPLNVTTEYQIAGNTFHNETDLVIDPSMSVKVLEGKIGGVLFDVTGADIDWEAVDWQTDLSSSPYREQLFEGDFPLSGFNTVGGPDILLDPNTAPTVTSLTGDTTVNESDTTTHSYSFTVTDPDATDNFTVIGLPDCGTGGSYVSGSLSVTENASDGGGSGSFQCYFPDGPASPTVKIQVEDTRQAESNIKSLAVTVNNVAPSVGITSGTSYQSVLPGKDIVPVTVSATDVKADTLTEKTEWNKDGGSFSAGLPSGFTFAGSGGAGTGTWTLSGTNDLSPGLYTIKVTVTDKDNGSTVQDIQIRSNTPPKITVFQDDNTANTTNTVKEGDTETYDFTVVDPDSGDHFTVADGYPDCGTGGRYVSGSLKTTADTSDGGGTGSFQCYFPDGPADTTVTIKVHDLPGAESNVPEIEVHVDNVAPAVTVDTTTQNVQYSDPIATVSITATDVVDDTLTAKTKWNKNGGDFTDGLPDDGTVDGGLSLSKTGSSTYDDGKYQSVNWELSGIADLDPGTYTIDVTISDEDGGSTDKTLTITVLPEDATVLYSTDNPAGVKVATDGGASPDFSLIVSAQEPDPELQGCDTNDCPGDIDRATMQMTLNPVGPGTPVVGPVDCTWIGDNGLSGYKKVATYECDFSGVEVNTYSVDATAGDYYVGGDEGVITIYDPSLGFTTGGGWFYWPGSDNPDTGYPGDKTSFGFTMKYNKKNVHGSLLVIRHLPDNSTYSLKSNAISSGMAVGENKADGCEWASFSGKATYQEPTWLDAVGNYGFAAYVEDCSGVEGTPPPVDSFWLDVWDKTKVIVIPLSVMNTPAYENTMPLQDGDITIPH